MVARTLPRLPFAAALAALSFAGLAAAPAAAQRPLVLPLTDSFGYRAHASAFGGCAVDFVDVATSGSPISLTPAGAAPALDEGGAVIELEAPFELYGRAATRLVASSNGYLALADSLLRDSGGDFSNDCPLPAIPDPGPAVAARVLVVHGDLDGGPGSGWVLHQFFPTCPRPSGALPDEPCTVIQWDSWSSHAGGHSFDAQAVLYHSSFAVAVQYRGTPPPDATVGIQDSVARTALAPTCAGVPLTPGTHAICFYDPRAPGGGPTADLSTSIDEGPKVVNPGGTAGYSITVTNHGPMAVSAAAVESAVDVALDCTWTCQAGAGGSCAAGPVAGPIMDVVGLDHHGVVTYSLHCLVDPAAAGEVTVVALVTPPSGVTDPEPANDACTATASVLVESLFADGFESGDTGAWSTTAP